MPSPTDRISPVSPATGFYHDASALVCDGVSLESLARDAGTPLYVYSAETLRSRYRQLDQAFGDYPHAIHYALKANSTLALVRLVKSLGGRIDANSGGEIEVALRAGAAPEEIVFCGVGKTDDELARAVTLGVKSINAESAGELARIDAIARARGKVARVALRVNPDIPADTHHHIATGHDNTKFGVPLRDAQAVIREAMTRPGLAVTGLHVHIGSQILDLTPLTRAATTIAELAGQLRQQGAPIEHVDVGGGLGISYDGRPVPTAADYGSALIGAIRPSGLTVIVEPGRWLVAPTGALLTTVLDVKPQGKGSSFVVVDAGMTELMRPALYGAYHRIVPVTMRDEPPSTCDIVGPVCETSDTLGSDREMPLPRPGDLLAVLDTGAYGSVMASNYNRRPLAAEVMVDQGAWRIVRRRQTIDDLLELEN